jgi:putative flippase GtrA
MPPIRFSRTFIRFALVGGVNTILGISLFPILYWLVGGRININIILTISYVLCTLSAFTMHKYVTFGSSGRATGDGLRFIAVTGILWALNVVLLNSILAVSNVHPVIVQTIIAVSLQLGNYVVLKRFVFTSKHATSTAMTSENDG